MNMAYKPDETFGQALGQFEAGRQGAAVTIRPEAEAGEEGTLHVQLLGGFRVSVDGRAIDEPEWPLRKAKSLIKLLALAPQHRMYREQIMDMLWPELAPEAAANNLHKALHIARRTLEPDLAAKTPSSYLHFQGEFVALGAPQALIVDVELFQQTSEEAQIQQEPQLYERALSLYSGDLLPEDRYEDWAMGYREELRATQFALLLGLAALWEKRGEIGAAIEALRQVVARDPAHEGAHAGLMRLLVRSGHRHLALRQYQHLRSALERELDAEPDPSVQALHQQILSGRFPLHNSKPSSRTLPRVLPQGAFRADASNLVGRERELSHFNRILEALSAGRGGLALIGGEAGLGKSRLAAEIAQQASALGATVLWGSGYEQEQQLPYGAVVVALEGFSIRMAPDGLRELLGEAAPELARLVPAMSSALEDEPHTYQSGPYDPQRTFAAIATFFRNVAERYPVVLVLDDLHAADETSVHLIHHLAQYVGDIPMFIVGVYRPEEVQPDSALAQVLAKVQQDGSGELMELPRLTYHDTELLLTSLLSGPADATLNKTVYALALGNPYYTEEAIRALRGRGHLYEEDGRWRLQRGVPTAWGRGFLRRRDNARPMLPSLSA